VSDVPAVFVHGLIGPFNAPETFEALLPRQSSSPDMNGYGQRARLPVTTDSQVEALHQHLSSAHPGRPVHLIAHSIGAVWAFTLAARFPGLVASITDVEGNFSLADAFWSSSLAALAAQEARSVIEHNLSDAKVWLKSSGVAPNNLLIARAEIALAYQPWRTVWESARAVVRTTGAPEYESMVKSVFDRLPVHLVAGERSSAGWKVPEWARNLASSDTLIPAVGHMMMLENPRLLGITLSDLLD
jgi:lipase